MATIDLAELDDHALAMSDGDASSLPELSQAEFTSVPVLLEALILRNTWRSQGRDVTYRTDYPLAESLRNALSGKQQAVALSQQERIVFLPLKTIPGGALDQWQEAVLLSALRMMEKLAIPKKAAQALCGAIGELIGNVYDHSGASDSGLVGVARRNGVVEFSVADAGRGVLAGYTSNPRFAPLADDGEALALAVCEHQSRLDEPGRGNGFRIVLRALSSLDARIRVRSGRCALLGSGTAGDHTFAIAQKGELRGFVVSVEIAYSP